MEAPVQEAVTWGALIAGASSVVSILSFWVKVGKTLQKAEAASAISQAAIAKVDLMGAQFAEYRVQVTRDFASSDDLKDVERRLVVAVDSLSTRFDRMAERLDRFLDAHIDTKIYNK